MMQIKSIILYNHQGKQRHLEFELNCVNLLTGESDTGKSAIIPIISYCLGNREFEIPEGIIREEVAWYAVLYQVGDKEVLVAKPKPKYGNIESGAFYKESEKIDIPNFDELKVNRYNIVDELSQLLRKSLNLAELDPKKIEDLQIGIDNTSFYLFQEREVIANKNILFYKQDRNVHRIIKTLPYFLGLKAEAELYIQEKLTKNKNELKNINNILTQQKNDRNKYENKIKDFFEQAKHLGIVEKNLLAETTNIDDMITKLKEICNWQLSTLPSEPDDLEPQQKAKLNQLKEELKKKNRKLMQYKTYSDTIEDYSTEVNEHKMRLQSIKLFEDHLLSINCPLCGSILEKNIRPEIFEMQKALTHLDKNLKTATQDKIDYSSQIKLLENEISNLAKQVDEENKKLLEIVQSNKNNEDIIRKLNSQNFKIGQLIGGVKNTLELTQISPVDEKELKNKKEKLESENKNLRKNLLDTKDSLEFQLSSLNRKITKLANEKLNLSYQGEYQFKLNRLEIIVKEYNSDHLTSLKAMGSSLNILSCHLVTLLALHEHFLTEKTPVPSFLILDQPIQGYLTDRPEDNDSEKIKKIIQLLIEIAQSIGLQIIVTEHEQLPQNGLHFVNDHWTKKNALIPLSW